MFCRERSRADRFTYVERRLAVFLVPFGYARRVLRFGVDPLDVVRYGRHGLFVRGRGFSIDREDRCRFRPVDTPFLGYVGPVGMFGEGIVDCIAPLLVAILPNKFLDFRRDPESLPAIRAP